MLFILFAILAVCVYSLAQKLPPETILRPLPLSAGSALLFYMVSGKVWAFLPAMLLWISKIPKRNRKKNIRKKLLLAFPDILDNISEAIKTGQGLEQSFRTSLLTETGISRDFVSEILFLQESGLSLSQAIRKYGENKCSEDIVLYSTVLSIAEKTGGPVAGITEKTAETIRLRQQMEEKIDSSTSQGRLQGVFLILIPPLLCAAMFIIDPDLIIEFIKSLTGKILIAAIILLETMGWFMIKKISAIKV
ncbi:MAG: type II secretion system F family protein [Fibrobacterota bacterium]